MSYITRGFWTMMPPVKAVVKAKDRTSKNQTPTEAKFLIGFVITILFLSVFFNFYMRYYFQFPSTLDDPLVPPYFTRAQDAMPFPRTLDPLEVQSSVRDAYAVAKAIPDVLAQQPCYCQKPRFNSLLNCFAGSGATDCEICVEEARLAGQLHHQGKSAVEIRAAIIKEYGRTSIRSLPIRQGN